MLDHVCSYASAGVPVDIFAECPVCEESLWGKLQRKDYEIAEIQKALYAVHPHRPLYHWSPAERRNQIIKMGLRPSMRPSIASPDWRMPYVCFADTPSWAWALSGGSQNGLPGEWDLWTTSLNKLNEPQATVTDQRPSGLYEVRTAHRVYKRDLWFVGSRIKD